MCKDFLVSYTFLVEKEPTDEETLTSKRRSDGGKRNLVAYIPHGSVILSVLLI